MGCFSFICHECGKGIESSSFSGQECRLFLLVNGNVVQRMKGQYDSYGRVFTKNLKSSKKWKMEWGKVCNLIFNSNEGDGIAAVHEDCFTGVIPKIQSDSDPNQGWGEEGRGR